MQVAAGLYGECLLRLACGCDLKKVVAWLEEKGVELPFKKNGRPPRPLNLEHLREFYSLGLSERAVADRLGFTSPGLAHAMKKRPEAQAAKAAGIAEYEKKLAAIDSKTNLLALAEKAGMTLQDIAGMIHKAGYDFGDTLQAWLHQGHDNVPGRLLKILFRIFAEMGVPELQGMKPKISAGQLFELVNEKSK